ncbi:hypothetical protein FQN52_001167 [Onygenales sp. PD_12]|nr:hypothetical protein FQN52_001167 [Onygenales sp. PD_12]
MFASKSIFFIAMLALFNIALAAVPGCMLGAVNTQKNPGNMKAVCASEKVQEQIYELCAEDKVDDALKAFSKACSEAGQEVSIIKKPGASPSGTGSAPQPTGSDGATPTGSGSEPTSTNAGFVHKADSLTVAAVVAIVGFAAVL